MQLHYPLNPATGLEDATLLPWTNGVPSTGTEGSYPPFALCTEPQAEIVNAIQAAGLTPASADPFQLLRAARGGQLSTFNDTGAANVMAITSTGTAHLALAKGLPFRIWPLNTNTSTAVTLKVDALSAAPVKKRDGTNPAIGDIVVGVPIDVVCDGSGFFRSITPLPSDIISTIVNTPGFYRTRLTANANFYISPTGSDSNNGLTAGTPWLTRQHAYNYVQQYYDLANYSVTFNMAAGSYTDSMNVSQPLVGASSVSSVVFQGAGSGSTVVSCATNSAYIAQAGALYTIAGQTIAGGGTGPAQGCCAYTQVYGVIQIGTDVVFAASSVAHMYANSGIITTSGSSYKIIGGGSEPLYCIILRFDSATGLFSYTNWHAKFYQQLHAVGIGWQHLGHWDDIHWICYRHPILRKLRWRLQYRWRGSQLFSRICSRRCKYAIRLSLRAEK